jgi:beta-phosphoglucomutase
MIQAVIFDLDGVIVDTAHYHFIAWKRLAEELGVNFTEKENEQLKGVSRMRSLEIILELGKIKLPDDEMERLATKKNEWFVEYINAMKPDEIFPGVKELIADLRANGIKVALASSSKNADTVLNLLNIKEYFDVIVDGTMIVHTKPDPEIFLLAARKLNTPSRNCLVFEDAEAGVEAALAAGMRCVGVGTKQQLPKATFIVAKTAQFTVPEIKKL